MMERWAVEIDRDDITRAALVPQHQAPLPPGGIEVAVDLTAMTANNVTYAALGKPSGLFGNDTGYWDFFADRDAAGRLPVWGFATVVRSDVPALAVGERLYGYWPLASHAVLEPRGANAHGFVDGAERRRTLPPFYNRYQRVAALEDWRAADDAWWPVSRPLYLTGWLIADQIADEQAAIEQVLVTAASSKTALGVAHALRLRAERPRVVALTSAASADFVRDSGFYDEVTTYDAIDTIATGDSALIDVAGNAAVVHAIHARLGDRLRLSLVVGKAHWDAGGARPPGTPQTGFFAPSRIEKRSADWGGAGLRARMGVDWQAFMAEVPRLFRLDRRQGGDAALAAYREAVAGRADPRAGVVIAR